MVEKKEYQEKIIYSCDIPTMRCGKATISPDECNASQIPIRMMSSNRKRNQNFDTTDSEKEARTTPSGSFTPVVEFNQNGQKIFRCPVCNLRSGTAAPLTPQDLSLTPHAFTCINKGKVPVER